MSVRALGPADLDAVERVYAAAFGAALNRRLVIGLVTNGARLLGAYEGDDLVGYGLSFTGHEAECGYAYSQTVAVPPEEQGRGGGPALPYGRPGTGHDVLTDVVAEHVVATDTIRAG